MKIVKLAPLALVLGLIGLCSYGAVSHTGAALISVAHADTGAPVVDPVATASAAPDAAIAMVETYGPIWGGMLLAFGLAGAVLKRNEQGKWVQGRVLAGATSGAAILGGVLVYHFHGGDVAGLLMTIYGAVMAFVHPPGASTPGAPARDPQTGRANVYLLAAVGILLGLIGCAALKTQAVALKDGVITCAKADKPKVEALALELGGIALGGVLTSGQVPWDAIKADAENAAKVQGIEVASCAFGDVVSNLDAILKAARPADLQSGIAERRASGFDHLASFLSAHQVVAVVRE